jgi:hypothetical protein
MKTRIHFAAHEKCIAILEMIHEVTLRAEQVRSNLYHYDNSPNPYHPVKLMNTREQLVTKQAHLRVLKTRLVSYYDKTLMKMMPDVLDRELKSIFNLSL